MTDLERAKAYLEDNDLRVLTDIAEMEGSTDEEPIWEPCWYIGWPYEPSAGIWGGSVSPIFLHPGGWVYWCLEQIEKGGELDG